MPNNVHLLGSSRALVPRPSFLGRLKDKLCPGSVKQRTALNTMTDASFCIDNQRTDLVFLWDITKECDARGIDTTLIEKADALMCEAHMAEKRDSGEPYHFHPRAVAMNLIKEFGIKDVNMICAALLHDVIEDNRRISKEFVAEEFNEDIVTLIDGVTKLDKSLGMVRDRENLKKLIAASADDPRVAILKLADNLHNIRTISAVEASRGRPKAEEIAHETLRVYAPLAQVLAVRGIRSKLEEAAYDFLYPEGMDEIRGMIARKKEAKVGTDGRTIQEAVRDREWQYREAITERLLDFGLVESRFEVRTEVKERSPAELYRIKTRFEGQGRILTEGDLLSDLYKLVYIIDIKDDAHGKTDEGASSLGCAMAHQIFMVVHSPLANRSRDAIIGPRADGYKGIDATINFGRYGQLRVSFMTPQMNSWYERGILSVDFRDSNATQVFLRKAARTLEGEWLTEDDIKTLLSDGVFEISIVTLEGDPISVPQGSTVRDFAYFLHTAVGNEAVSGIVNGIERPLDHVLLDGDYVTIVGDEEQVVGPDALRQVRTPHAKEQILKFLRGAKRTEKETLDAGKASLERAAQEKYLTIDDIIYSPLAPTVFRRILPEIDHNTPILIDSVGKVWGIVQDTDMSIKKCLGKDGLEHLKNYFACVVGTGAIDSKRIVAEYVKVQDSFNSAVSEIVTLVNRVQKALSQREKPDSSLVKALDARFGELIGKVMQEPGLLEPFNIQDPSWPKVLGAKANGAATAMPKIARVISEFITNFRVGEERSFLRRIDAMSDSIEEIRSREIKITLRCRNRPSLTNDITNGLSRGLGLNIPKYYAEGEGSKPALVEVTITPETPLQQQQIINIVRRAAKDESAKIKVAELPEDQLG